MTRSVSLPIHALAMRYVQPLREGGSLPAVVDTDAGMFVAKFRGAGQGAKALIAELLAGMLAQTLGLPIPELAIVNIPAQFGRSEGDPEIQEILRKSHGTNVGLQYLDGAFNFDVRAAGEFVSPGLAARIVWFDAFITNPDRTHQNPNLLIWQRQPWLIDHGAALYAQHDWPSVDTARAAMPFPRIEKHVLLTHAGDILAADRALRVILSENMIRDIVEQLPDTLLLDPALRLDFASPQEARDRYRWYLTTRLAASHTFVEIAVEAQAAVRRQVPLHRTTRR